jgi:hypothetical protein
MGEQAAVCFFVRAVLDGHMDQKTAVCSALNMKNLDAAQRVLLMEDEYFNPRIVADVAIQIAQTNEPEGDVLSRLLLLLGHFDGADELSVILHEIFSAETTSDAMWLILRACVSLPFMTETLWTATMTSACKDVDDSFFDLGVTKKGLPKMFQFRRPVIVTPGVTEIFYPRKRKLPADDNEKSLPAKKKKKHTSKV